MGKQPGCLGIQEKSKDWTRIAVNRATARPLSRLVVVCRVDGAGFCDGKTGLSANHEREQSNVFLDVLLMFFLFSYTSCQ